jgi:hypothetical protein
MLEDDGETSVSETTLRRTFKAIGLYYGKGNKQNVLHNTKGVVDQRNEYVRRRLENINEKTNLPIRPEVFLDESYCHLSHQASKTWLPSRGVVTEKGRKPMLAMFSATVFYDIDGV